MSSRPSKSPQHLSRNCTIAPVAPSGHRCKGAAAKEAREVLSLSNPVPNPNQGECYKANAYSLSRKQMRSYAISAFDLMARMTIAGRSFRYLAWMHARHSVVGVLKTFADASDNGKRLAHHSSLSVATPMAEAIAIKRRNRLRVLWIFAVKVSWQKSNVTSANTSLLMR